MAAFDEFTALLTDSALTADYDHIVFDTAPTSHTIRLLQLPGAWNDFLEEGKSDASCLGPLAGLEKQCTQYKSAVDALTDPTAHLSETLNEAMANLAVGWIDPHVETERYRQHVLETKDTHLNAKGRALLEARLTLALYRRNCGISGILTNNPGSG